MCAAELKQVVWLCRRVSGTPQVLAAQNTIAITADGSTRRVARGTIMGPGAAGAQAERLQ